MSKSKIAQVLGAAVATVSPTALTKESPSIGKTVLLTAAGGVAGALLWEKHPVLGVLFGMAVGDSAYGLVEGGQDRADALCKIGATGLGVAASLKWRKHPVLGYVGGALVGSVLCSAIPGTSANDYVKRQGA